MSIVLEPKEVVSEGWHVGEGVQHNVHVVVGLDVVEAHDPRQVLGAVQGDGEPGGGVQAGHCVQRERRRHDVLQENQRQEA